MNFSSVHSTSTTVPGPISGVSNNAIPTPQTW